MEKITEEMIPEMAELFLRTFNAEPWNDKWTIEQVIERLSDFYHMPKFEGMVEKQDGKIIALILGRKEQYYAGPQFEILEFCVDAKMQRKGIGRKLLREFLEYLGNMGIKHYFLCTLHGEKTEGFYEQNGFATNQDMCMMGRWD